MDITNHIATFSKRIALVVIVLITSSCPACCEESQFDTYEGISKSFWKANGKRIQSKVGRGWFCT